MGAPEFRRHTIYAGPPSERVLCAVGDLDRDGTPEIVIGARAPAPELYWLDRTPSGSWRRRLMDDTFPTLEAGGALGDLDGDGDLDFVAGADSRGDMLWWWECPDDPTAPWPRREIFRMPANQSHDQCLADLDGDGRPELYFWNQKAEMLFTVPVPADPRRSPWPGVAAVVTGVREEGLAVADVDGDGRPELIAGQSWYRRAPSGGWERHEYARGHVAMRVVAADFDGDGRAEIVLAEGDASVNKREFGRLVRFRRPGVPEGLWEPEILHDRLLDPHSLQVADFDGDGRPDLFVGEMGLPTGAHPHAPAQRVYLARGARLEEHVIDRGIGVHEAHVIELDGRMGIVGKPYRNLKGAVPREPEADAIYLWLPA